MTKNGEDRIIYLHLELKQIQIQDCLGLLEVNFYISIVLFLEIKRSSLYSERIFNFILLDFRQKCRKGINGGTERAYTYITVC